MAGGQFKHFGEEAETREAWLARQAAEAARDSPATPAADDSSVAPGRPDIERPASSRGASHRGMRRELFALVGISLAGVVGVGSWYALGQRDRQDPKGHMSEDADKASVTTPPTLSVSREDEDSPVASSSPVASVSVEKCADGGSLEGRWLFTTTVAGAARPSIGVTGQYAVEFSRDGCDVTGRVEKYGYVSGRGATVFDSASVQAGVGPIQDITIEAELVWATLEVRLARPDGTKPLSMRYRLAVDGSALYGEYRYADDSWETSGMWGSLVGARGATTQPVGGRLRDQPCVVQCRIGCDAPRREADSLSAAAELSDCLAGCRKIPATVAGCDAAPFSFDRERIGGLGRGATPAEVAAELGRPHHATEGALAPATGSIQSAWHYDGATVIFDLNQAKLRRGVRPGWRVDAIDIREPSTLRTARGVGIGDKAEVAQRAYGPWIDKEDSIAHESLVVGSIYGGLILTLREGRVTGIFLGHGAE